MARLSIPDEATFAEFTVTTSTASFPFDFAIFAKADLTVLVDGVAVDQSAFTLSATLLDGGGYQGGTVVLTTAVDDVTVRIERNIAPERTSNFAPARSTPVGSVDQSLNRAVAGLQDLKRRKMDYPAGALEGLFLAFDADGLPVGASGTGSDSALRTDLGADNGGSLVAFKADLLGAQARSMTAKLAETVSVNDFAGVSGAQKLQAAFNSGAASILIPGDLVVSSDVTSSGNVRLYGPGTIDQSGGGHILVGTGVTQIADLSGTIVPFQTDITFAAAHGLVEGDVFCVWNPTDGSYSPIRPAYRAGDMFQVATVLSSTQVRIYGVAQDTYAAADVNVYKLGGGSFEVDGVTINPPPTGVPLTIDGCVGVKIDKLKMPSGVELTGVLVKRSFDVAIGDNDIVSLNDDAYTITIGSCQKVTVNPTRSQLSKRHVIAFGGGDDPGEVPCADVRIIGLIGSNIAVNGIGSSDIHGNCKRITYESCILSIANMAGEGSTYRGCYITGTPTAGTAAGTALTGSEIVGGVFTIENCHIVSAGTSDAQGSHVHLVVGDRVKPFRLVMRNNTFENVGNSPQTTQAITVEGGSTTPADAPRIDVDIEGLTWVGSAPPAVLFALKGAEDVEDRSSVRIKNVSGFGRLYASSANYDTDFEGPGLKSGITTYGDESVTLVRSTMRDTLRFATTLTANRTITFPDANDHGPGDTMLVARPATGAFTLSVGGIKSLAAGEWCRVGYAGSPAIGSWVLLEFGSL